MEELIIAFWNLTPLEWAILITLDLIVNVAARVAVNLWQKRREEAQS
jgi:hypothetical protein